MNDNARESGWYWVKQTGFAFWECCQWNGYAWHGIWIESVPDSAFSEIGARIPAPGEPWKCVPVGWLKNLRSSIVGDCYMGEEWEIATIEAMLADAPEPGGE